MAAVCVSFPLPDDHAGREEWQLGFAEMGCGLTSEEMEAESGGAPEAAQREGDHTEESPWVHGVTLFSDSHAVSSTASSVWAGPRGRWHRWLLGAPAFPAGVPTHPPRPSVNEPLSLQQSLRSRVTDLLTPGSVPMGGGVGGTGLGDHATWGASCTTSGRGAPQIRHRPPFLHRDSGGRDRWAPRLENWGSLWALVDVNLSPWLPGVTHSVFVHLLGHQMRKPVRRWRFCGGGCPSLET